MNNNKLTPRFLAQELRYAKKYIWSEAHTKNRMALVNKYLSQPAFNQRSWVKVFAPYRSRNARNYAAGQRDGMMRRNSALKEITFINSNH